MKIRVKLMGQARTAAGREDDAIECRTDASLNSVLTHLAEKFGDDLRRILLDDRGKPHASVMLFINDEQVYPSMSVQLRDADVVTVMPPISGG